MVDAEVADDEPDIGQLSICRVCAKHPALIRLIESDLVLGAVCATCQSTTSEPKVFAVARRPELLNLLSGLIRFYFDEFEYNGHWGADESVEALLTRENPILKHENTLWNTRDPSRSQELLYHLFSENPYPPEDAGISVYAGFDREGGRNVAFSIQKTESSALRTFRARLLQENHFDVEPDVLRLIDSLGARVASSIEVGTRFYRARIGIAKQYSKVNAGWRPSIEYEPLSGKALAAPPPQSATAGRLNRAGVSFLYLSSDHETAAAEVRPHPSHRVSIGVFESVEPIKVATFDVDIGSFVGSEYDLDRFHFVHSTDKLMALPVVPGEASRYSITQLIADCLRQRGYGGVRFQSSVGKGQNLCVFRPADFAPVDGSAEVYVVESLKYGLKPLPTLREPSEDHYVVN